MRRFVLLSSLSLAVVAWAGIDGAAVSVFDRIAVKPNVRGQSREVVLTAWRGERVHAHTVVVSDRDEGTLVLASTPLALDGAADASCPGLTGRFVRLANVKCRFEETERHLVGDCLDPAAAQWPTNGFASVWWTGEVPATARPGTYRGACSVRGTTGEVRFPVTLKVLDRSLPEMKDRKFVLDLWQHPWTVASYYGVKPFSPEHYARMEPLYRELAAGGQRSIDTSITDMPWGEEYTSGIGDDIRTMVVSRRASDGTWQFDFSTFDEYVSFARRCGLGPQIHLYAIVKFLKSHIFYYLDAETGERRAEELYEGTPAYEKFLTPLVKATVEHLRAKGWLQDAYMAIDEVEPERLVAARAFLRRVAPELKFAVASNVDPMRYATISDETDILSQILWNGNEIKSLFDGSFDRMRDERRKKGLVTTYYVCTAPRHPNTWLSSPLAETEWIGLYAAAKEYDGILRWAAFMWGRDPFGDPARPDIPAGESFMLYPGGLASVRWEILRDSMEDWEKIRLLKENGKLTVDLENALNSLDYDTVNSGDDALTRRQVETVLREMEKASDGVRMSCMCGGCR